jgi:peptidyl-prolyl cis-trans isomerase A (cyclophilin A)
MPMPITRFSFSCLLIASLLVFTQAAFSQASQKPKIEITAGAAIQKDNFYPRVKFQTSMGDIIIELNRSKAPVSVNNFLTYVVDKEYDNTVFHRVIPDYIVQGGGYDIEYKDKKENFKIINESGNGMKNEAMTIAMARMNDPHSAKRQFFFNVTDNANLDPGRNWGYTVFGDVIEGQEIIEAMSNVKTEVSPIIGYPDTPVENIVLRRASLMPEMSFD